MAKPATATDELDIFALLEEVERKKQPAIDALLADREAINVKLARLGHREFELEPVTAGKQRKPRGPNSNTKPAKGESSKYDASKSCYKCGSKDHPMAGHDTKAHNQAADFKDIPFTHEELKKRGYWPPQ